jgi:hypothetical protein
VHHRHAPRRQRLRRKRGRLQTTAIHPLRSRERRPEQTLSISENIFAIQASPTLGSVLQHVLISLPKSKPMMLLLPLHHDSASCRMKISCAFQIASSA